jgi:chitinase
MPGPTAAPTQTPTPTPAPSGFCASSGKPKNGFLVIGYLPDYRDLNPEWGNCLTDIVYFSAQPMPDGSLDTSLLSESTLQALLAMKGRYGTRIFISLGGWERSQGFAPMVADPRVRKKFEDNLLAFSLAHALDGVDFDWEFPENAVQYQGYTSLLQEIKTAFQPHGMLISMALSSDADIYRPVYQYADRIHVMSYDHPGLHSTYDQAVQDMNNFVAGGFARANLFLGVPFYGRPMDNPDDEFTYAELMQQFHPAPDQDEVHGIYFNGIDTIRRKTCYAMNNGFGGIMIWELGQDSADNTSLLRTVYQAAVNGCPP